MPTYEYKCENCGYLFELFSGISNLKSGVSCPICVSRAKLMISGGSGLIFKGSGFYVNDYKNKSGPKFRKPKRD